MSTQKMIIRFDEAPPVGWLTTHDGQSFVVAAVEPYRRRDGGISSVVTWETVCVDCEGIVRFECGQGLAIKRRRCDEHKWKFGSARPVLAP